MEGDSCNLLENTSIPYWDPRLKTQETAQPATWIAWLGCNKQSKYGSSIAV